MGKRARSDAPSRLLGVYQLPIASGSIPEAVGPLSEGSLAANLRANDQPAGAESLVAHRHTGRNGKQEPQSYATSTFTSTTGAEPLLTGRLPSSSSRSDKPVIQAYTRGNKQLLMQLTSVPSEGKQTAKEIKD